MAAQQKVRYEVRRGYKKEAIQKIAEAAVELIRTRTLGGQDKDGDDFYPYTDEYADKKGVGVNDVDLYLTGDMLNNLEVLKVTDTYFEIGYPRGYKGMGKVEGNRLGTYGNSSPVTAPRDFLELDDKDLNELMKEYPMSGEEELDGIFEDAVDRVYRESRGR